MTTFIITAVATIIMLAFIACIYFFVSLWRGRHYD